MIETKLFLSLSKQALKLRMRQERDWNNVSASVLANVDSKMPFRDIKREAIFIIGAMLFLAQAWTSLENLLQDCCLWELAWLSNGHFDLVFERVKVELGKKQEARSKSQKCLCWWWWESREEVIGGIYEDVKGRESECGGKRHTTGFLGYVLQRNKGHGGCQSHWVYNSLLAVLMATWTLSLSPSLSQGPSLISQNLSIFLIFLYRNIVVFVIN